MNDSLFYSECFVDEAEEGPLKVNTLNGSVAIWAFLTASRLFSRFFASKAVASGSTAFLRGEQSALLRAIIPARAANSRKAPGPTKSNGA